VAHLAVSVVACEARSAFFDDVFADPEIDAVYQNYRAEHLTRLIELVESGHDSGTVRACRPALVAEVLDAAAERLRHVHQVVP
ncbi:MAG TPA: hypothetical protein PLV68_14790, partial [Ilumatobacteraceae bacterium]|nr:hypothetical protein [Ilumatobacteraceae bacterium]